MSPPPVVGLEAFFVVIEDATYYHVLLINMLTSRGRWIRNFSRRTFPWDMHKRRHPRPPPCPGTSFPCVTPWDVISSHLPASPPA